MAKTIIKATFKGTITEGYETNKEYTLAVEYNVIQRTTGSGRIAYGSLQRFLSDWEKIKEIKTK